MIRVGITELHGIAQECIQHPAEDVHYSSVDPSAHWTNKLITSPAKGVLDYFESDKHDVIEAPLFPILTNNNWIYTPAESSACLTFSLFNLPMPRLPRALFMKHVFMKDNFKKLIFKSQAGLGTLNQYPILQHPEIMKKVEVVYPAIGNVDDSLIQYNTNKINILFSGDFFRKGGANLVDAFEQAQKKHDNIHLRICTRPDLQTSNEQLRKKYQKKIEENNNISLGFVDRKVLMNEILPQTDIFASPTYQETFGFALLEAMAYGIPVISTNHFAIPEIIEHNASGLLIDTEQFDFIKNFKGYTIEHIPEDFNDYMQEQMYKHLTSLIESEELRRSMGQSALQTARNKFGFEARNKAMTKIYQEAI
ncbi:hypothetical protein A9Q99_20215 [Gammaproteobacteria bacterium 45_16_T64]|nr:hypothetical protein A9Q99_20215 [Gammaproteobacteria bacterium 45_16_T64]